MPFPWAATGSWGRARARSPAPRNSRGPPPPTALHAGSNRPCPCPPPPPRAVPRSEDDGVTVGSRRSDRGRSTAPNAPARDGHTSSGGGSTIYTAKQTYAQKHATDGRTMGWGMGARTGAGPRYRGTNARPPAQIQRTAPLELRGPRLGAVGLRADHLAAKGAGSIPTERVIVAYHRPLGQPPPPRPRRWAR